MTKEMAREKYESLALAQLKVWAKQTNLKLPANAKKSEVIDALIEYEIKSGNIVDDSKAAKISEEKPKRVKENKENKENNENKEVKEKTVQDNSEADAGSVKEARKPAANRKKNIIVADENTSSSEKNTSREKSSASEKRKTDAVKKEGASRKSKDNAEVITEDANGAKEDRKSSTKTGAKVKIAETENGQEAVSAEADKEAVKEAVKEVVKEEQQAKPENSKRMAPSGEEYYPEQDTGKSASGILEVMSDGFGFIRCENFLPGDHDVYVSPSQIKRFGLRTGDILEGNLKVKGEREKFQALLYLTSINGMAPLESTNRFQFENMTPIFPNERIKLAVPGAPIAMRIMDLLCPVGKGQRGMIVSPPKAGKTTLLKSVAKSVKISNPNMHMIILLIDERPEEVTDIMEEVMGPNVEVIYSTFDETPEHHKRVSEMAIERARRLVEYNKDVIILLDSITRLTRAYNQVVPPSGRTLSGGLDPAALHMPKRFYGAARNMREGGSLTILATALVETGSKMDDVVYEEFKGTGNMEIVLDRKLSERRVFPAIDIPKSGTRRDDLLLTPIELEVINSIRRSFNEMSGNDSVDKVLDMFSRTQTNQEFINYARKVRY